MNHYILSALLLAGLASCSKKDPDPTPTPTPNSATLLAKWHPDSTWVSGGTAATLYQKNSVKAYAGLNIQSEFTATELIQYSGGSVDSRQTYTKSGSTLQFGDPNNVAAIYNRSTIQSLTAHRLVLVSYLPQGYPAPNVYATNTTAYSR